jgi:hypothetical protein
MSVRLTLTITEPPIGKENNVPLINIRGEATKPTELENIIAECFFVALQGMATEMMDGNIGKVETIKVDLDKLEGNKT